MERAGLSPYTYNHFVSYNEWKKHKPEMRILNNIFRGDDISAYLLEYGNEMNGDDRLECQLFEMGKLMGKDIEKVPLDKILKILAYTLKDSNIDNIRTLHTYSTQEMILLYMLSRKLFMIGEKDKAWEIQDCLLGYWKNMDADICGRSTQYLYLLHSLLLNLYNEEKYYEAISICQEAIEIGKEHKNMFLMIEFYCYNCTILSNIGKREEALDFIDRAIGICFVLNDHRLEAIHSIKDKIIQGEYVDHKLFIKKYEKEHKRI